MFRKKKVTIFDLGVRLLAVLFLGYVAAKSLGRVDLVELDNLGSLNAYANSTATERLTSLVESTDLACVQAGGDFELTNACLGLIDVAERQVVGSKGVISHEDYEYLSMRVMHLNTLYRVE